MDSPVYLDYNATTPLDARVLAKMLPYFTETYGNASSIDHIHGHSAKNAVDKARKNVAKLLGCRKDNEIIFTSGATESNNLALMGAFRKYRANGNHIISSSIEHPCVLETLEYLKSEGADVTLLPVDKFGLIDVSELNKVIRKETILISIMFANNEIGTIEPIKEIGEIARDKKIIFHTDAAQAVGHMKIDVYDLNIDLMSFSAHKFYGPKGVGGLFVRSFSPFIKLSPVLFGGGHERGVRPGTLNVTGIVGISEALNVAALEMDNENEIFREMAMNLFNKLRDAFPDIELNGHPERRLSHNLNLTIPGIENKALINILKNKLSVSTGSACTTIKVKPSHVLKAIGLTDDEAFQSIRIAFGRLVKEAGIAEAFIDGISQLKS